MKDAEKKKQQIVQRLRVETDAILRRDVNALNRLDDVMAEADTPREDNPTPDENH